MRTFIPSRKSNTAFTLVELLVVIGIIAVLISILLPTLNSARRQADTVRCLSNLRQLHNGYNLYAGENKGTWPVAAHYWLDANSLEGASPVAHRDKRWHDFISKYVMAPQQVTDPATGKSYTSAYMNFNGTMGNEYVVSSGGYRNHGEFGSAADPVWAGTMINRTNPIWGCPTWNKLGLPTQFEYGVNVGYAMNIFPFAPNDEGTGTGFATNTEKKKTAKIIDDGGYAGGQWLGNYFKASAWTRPTERALLFDAIHGGGYFGDAAFNIGFPWQPDTSTPLPRNPTTNQNLDWRRHARNTPGGVKSTENSINVLYCDGHAATTSAREAYRAIRFH